MITKLNLVNVYDNNKLQDNFLKYVYILSYYVLDLYKNNLKIYSTFLMIHKIHKFSKYEY